MASHRTLLLSLSLLSFSLCASSRDLYHPTSSDAIHLLSFSFTTLSLLNLHPPSSSSSADVHDLLPLYGLPRGIIPNRVKSFAISKDGVFTVEFQSHCYVQFSDELVSYDKKISGKLRYGSVHDVVGIKAKKLLVWLPVSGIHSHPGSGMIEFFVGFVSEKLPAAQFQDVPVCNNKACSEETDMVASI